MVWRTGIMRFLALLLLLPGVLSARDLEVDVELFLAVDVSRSMSPAELEIQRRGYAEALTSNEVMAAIQNGMLGRVAVTYVEWAGEYSQRVIVPWQLLETPQDAANIADRITARFDAGLRRTSISGALLYATQDFDGNGFEGLRRVIDVSGDGPNNQGRPVTRTRDKAISEGFIINGLPLMTTDALSQIWGIPDLDIYYQNCVIGGPGAFVVPVLSWDQFAAAVKRKLVLEIAGLLPAPPERIHPVAAYDCLIGEKIWERNRNYFELP
ncbi:MAG: DUF1194 domain-containing protein [Pseudomonadota bacterium]